MAKSHKTVIGNIKQICEDYEYYHRSDEGDNGEGTLQRIQDMVNTQLGYITTV